MCSESDSPGATVIVFELTTKQGKSVSRLMISIVSHPTFSIAMLASLDDPTATCPKSISLEETSVCARTEGARMMHEANMKNFQALIASNEPIARKNNSSG